MKLRELFEAPGRTAVVAFGRMNPPTIGHAKLVDKIKSIDGDHYVFLSQSQKPKTDPLDFADKLRYSKFFFPEITIGNPKVRTPIQMMQYLQELGYTDIIYIAGSDRVPAFDKLFNDYNGKDYTFNSIQVVSAGERDPDADGAEGMSASKMRAAAAEGNLDTFKQGVPRPEVADEMFAAVRKGMGITEPEMAEDASEDEEDEFHRKLDKLVHKTFGHSSDEKKGKISKIRESNLDKSVPQTIKPVKVPAFPQVPQQDGDLGDGQQVSTNPKTGEKQLSGADGVFVWDAQGKPKKWKAPNFGGVQQTHDMKTGDITVDLEINGMEIQTVYDKTGKIKPGQTAAAYDFGLAKVSTGPQGNSVTVRGATPAQDQTSEDLAADRARNANALPKKMKSFLEPFPAVPQAQAEPYTTDNGTQISPMKGGGVKLSDDRGTFIWDPQGNPLTYVTPKIKGFHQVHDMRTGNFIVYYQDGPVKVEQEYDKSGSKIGDEGASFNAGPVSVSRDRSGRNSASYTIGDQTISTDDKDFTGFNTSSIRKRQGRQDIGQ